tara:strand:- start:1164 stop:1613 length:450 start_codon:yes stop_codon:yes gene_type:complete
MFGMIAKLGSKILGGMRLGSKVLSSAGAMGTKFSTTANKAFDMASKVPIVGDLIDKSPIAQGLRGVVGGIGKVGAISSQAGSILGNNPSGNITDPSSIIEKGRKIGRMTQAVREEGRAIGRGFGQARRGFSHHFNRRGHEDDRGTTRHG